MGYQPVTTEEKENWQQLIKNHANDPAVKDKTQKKQEGGTITPHISVVYDDDQSDGPVLTRRQSRELSELNKGFNRSQ